MSTECSGRVPLMHQCVFYRWAHIPNVNKPVLFGSKRMICQVYDWMANYNHKFLTEETSDTLNCWSALQSKHSVKPSQSRVKLWLHTMTVSDLYYTHNPPPPNLPQG